jgi:crotonobetainyl-CoA:carnitine CoA-transferase CaiB-like acyl-CoA transferase
MRTDRTALAGLRVLDLTQVMAGPFCAMQLCDMGADVIKVEPPGGDSTRRMAGSRGTDSPAFQAVNRGKRAIVLDLTAPAGQQAFRRLASRADVLIENLRPGVMQRFGLDYETLSAAHPGLIYASISGYGHTGPQASKGGFDLIAQGVSGLMSVTGEPGGPPVKVGVPLTDLGAALFALAGILAALHYRRRTGRGQFVDASLLDAGIALSVWEAAEYFGEGTTPGPLGSAHRMLAPYQAIRCADGHITLGAGTDRLFTRLCEVLGHADWATEAAFATAGDRVANRSSLIARIESITTAEPKAHWLVRLDEAGIPCGPINDYAEAFADAQVRARGMVVATEHPALGRQRMPGSAIKLSETPTVTDRRAPLLGEHTRDVLREAGCSTEEIDAAMRAQGSATG